MSSLVIAFVLLSLWKHAKKLGEGVFEIHPVFILGMFLSYCISAMFIPQAIVLVMLFFFIVAFFVNDAVDNMFSVLIRPVKVSFAILVIIAILMISVPDYLVKLTFNIVDVIVGILAMASGSFIILWLMDIDNGFHRLTEKLINNQTQ